MFYIYVLLCFYMFYMISIYFYMISIYFYMFYININLIFNITYCYFFYLLPLYYSLYILYLNPTFFFIFYFIFYFFSLFAIQFSSNGIVLKLNKNGLNGTKSNVCAGSVVNTFPYKGIVLSYS